MFEYCEVYERIEEEFEGVVIMVTLRLRELSFFERSSRGMVWP